MTVGPQAPAGSDAQALLAASLAGTSTAGGPGLGPSNIDISGDWSAYWGTGNKKADGDAGRQRRELSQTDAYKSQTDMQTWLQQQWANDAKFRLIMNQYATAIPGYGTGYKSVAQMWDHAGAYSAQLLAGGRKLTPMQVLQLWAGGKATGLGNSPIGGNGTGATTHTSTNVSYDLSDPQTAKALTNAVLSSALGREASADEYAMYRNALNSYEKANPSKNTSTTHTDATGNSSTTSTSTGGASQAGREQVLKDKASATAEGQAFQGQILASRVG